jgi:hypothetical protein
MFALVFLNMLWFLIVSSAHLVELYSRRIKQTSSTVGFKKCSCAMIVGEC